MFRGRLAGLLFGALPVLFLGAFFLWPVASLYWMGLFGADGFDLRGTFEALTSERTRRVTLQTMLQASTATALSILLGVPAAFVLYRLRFRGRSFLRGVISVPFVLPTVVVAAAFVSLFGPGGFLFFARLDRTFTLLVLALTFFNITVVARIVGTFWESLDRKQNEAARMLGASPARAFVTVTLPHLWRPIASSAGIVFLFCASSFGVVFILGGKKYANIETEIYRSAIQLFDLRLAATLAVLQTLIVIATILVSSRFQSSPSKMLNPRSSETIFKAREHLPAVLIFAATLLLLHSLPIISLLTSSFKDAYGSWTLQNFATLFGFGDEEQFTVGAGNAIFLSLKFALFASAAALFMGLLLAVFLTRRTKDKSFGRVKKAVEMLAMLPLGVSAVALGLGLLVSMNRPFGLNIDLRTSLILIPIAQTLIALPLVVRTLLPRLAAIDGRVLESASVLGASPLRVLLTVELPQLRGALSVSAGFAFAAALGEFGAASFLVRGPERTLPVLIGDLLGSPVPEHHRVGLAAALVLALLTAAAMVFAEAVAASGKGAEDARITRIGT